MLETLQVVAHLHLIDVQTLGEQQFLGLASICESCRKQRRHQAHRTGWMLVKGDHKGREGVMRAGERSIDIGAPSRNQV
jgi:hypothetical protein